MSNIVLRVPVASQEELKKIENDAVKIESHLFYYVGAPNSLAGMAIADTIDVIIKNGLYKQDIKHAVLAANKKHDDYLRWENQSLPVLRQHQFYNDFIDIWVEALQPHVDRLVNNVTRILRLNKCEYAEVQAHVFTTGSVIAYAVDMFDSYFNGNRVYGQNLGEFFLEARLGKCLKAWSGVVYALRSHVKRSFGFDSEYKLLNKAKQNFRKYAYSEELLDRCIRKAMEKNPGVKKG